MALHQRLPIDALDMVGRQGQRPACCGSPRSRSGTQRCAGSLQQTAAVRAKRWKVNTHGSKPYTQSGWQFNHVYQPKVNIYSSARAK
jgi:hypothetical protein